MDPQTLQMMAQALMSGGGQPKPQPMQSGTGGMYGMPSAQGGGMLGSSPYQSINPNAMQPGGMGGYPSGGANPNQLQQPYQSYAGMQQRPDNMSGGTSNGL